MTNKIGSSELQFQKNRALSTDFSRTYPKVSLKYNKYRYLGFNILKGLKFPRKKAYIV